MAIDSPSAAVGTHLHLRRIHNEVVYLKIDVVFGESVFLYK